jgi:hypothetical protein
MVHFISRVVLLHCGEIFTLRLKQIRPGVISMLTLGKLYEKVCSEMWDLGTNSAFALGRGKTAGHLDRVGQSHDLPDAYWLLASGEFEHMKMITPASVRLQ